MCVINHYLAIKKETLPFESQCAQGKASDKTKAV